MQLFQLAVTPLCWAFLLGCNFIFGGDFRPAFGGRPYVCFSFSTFVRGAQQFWMQPATTTHTSSYTAVSPFHVHALCRGRHPGRLWAVRYCTHARTRPSAMCVFSTAVRSLLSSRWQKMEDIDFQDRIVVCCAVLSRLLLSPSPSGQQQQNGPASGNGV